MCKHVDIIFHIPFLLKETKCMHVRVYRFAVFFQTKRLEFYMRRYKSVYNPANTNQF